VSGIYPQLALLVIDMPVDFFDRQPALSAPRVRLVTGINELARTFRAAGHPVIWVRQEFQPDLSDSFLEMRDDQRGADSSGVSRATGVMTPLIPAT
jgi:nicotinamidase-related amidase